MVGNAVVDYFARLCGKRTTLLLWAAGIQTVAAIGIGLSPSFPIALICLLVVTATMGVVGPVRQAYIHQMVPGEQRATVVSFDSMVANLGGVGGQAGLGYLAKVRDYPTGYIVGGAATVLAIPLYVAIRRLEEDADRIVGKAGKRSPCAAQGLASAGAVDDKARNRGGRLGGDRSRGPDVARRHWASDHAPASMRRRRDVWTPGTRVGWHATPSYSDREGHARTERSGHDRKLSHILPPRKLHRRAWAGLSLALAHAETTRPRPTNRSGRSSFMHPTRLSPTCAGGSLRHDGRSRRRSPTRRKACRSRRCRSSRATGRRTTTGERPRRG